MVLPLTNCPLQLLFLLIAILYKINLISYHPYHIMETIELRSDTMTILTKQMRQSILTSPSGDWNYNQDPTVIELEKYAAELFGAEDAAYVPSATFGNQCALLTISHPGQEIIIRDQSHIIRHQNASVGRIARMMTKTVSIPFGYLTPEELKKYLRKKKDHQAPKCGVLCLEYPTFEGVIPSLESIQECSKMARDQGINVHIDGARIFSGLAESKIDPKQIMKHATTLTICLSKGLLAPIGSIVVGKSKALMAKFKVNRKMMGGVFRKPGVVAGAALISLRDMPKHIWQDNEMARVLASRLDALSWTKVVKKVETNMVYFQFTEPNLNIPDLQQFLFKNKVLSWIGNSTNRFMLHHYIRQRQIDTLIELMQAWKKEQGQQHIIKPDIQELKEGSKVLEKQKECQVTEEPLNDV